MGKKPYMTSDDLIESIKRKISLPVYQITFTEDDILAFVDEEMTIGQIPSIMQFHEEFFTFSEDFPLVNNTSTYPIPSRAIGMKLRDLFYQDMSGNLYEMTRIHPEDQGFFQRNLGSDQTIHKFFYQGNDIVLTPLSVVQPTGSLHMVYYMRPNKLVLNERAAFVTRFIKSIVIDNTTLVSGDALLIGNTTLIADVDFAIGATSVDTATNIVAAIPSSECTASNGTPETNIITTTYTVRKKSFSTTNTAAFSISNLLGMQLNSVPSHFSTSILYDLLQTDFGHKIYDYSHTAQSLDPVAQQIFFLDVDIDQTFSVNDYICQEYECIIPQIPDDLHTALSERTTARILAAQGDKAGLDIANSKIQEIELRQGTLVDNRCEGAPLKILARHTHLKLNKTKARRRF